MSILSRIKWLVLSIVCCAVFTGCGSLTKFQIAIESDPEGARVEVNNDYLGRTPTTCTVQGNADRSFNGNWVQGSVIEFVATPPTGSKDLFVQRKTFSPSAFFKQGEHIPEKMFFDMHLKPEQSGSEHLQIAPQ